MSKKEEEVIVDVEAVYTKSEQWIVENQKSLSIIFGAIVLLLLSYFAYKNFILQPQEVEAQEQMWQAQRSFDNDSLELALNGSDVAYGFLDIIDNYGITESSNLATYYAGVSYLRLGDYETAINYLEDYDCVDVLVCAIALGATGDAYMELGQADRAIDYYESAADHSANDFTAPIYLMKAARAYEELGDYSEALVHYNRIKMDHSSSNEGAFVDKYIARAEGQMGK
ncbi:MAG: tetratricopeptide repeat protein [Flavobacteriales bacterium]|jgi:tetratricopeptide (TPR) repeat protein|nr:tetratricopeptide repeat protein [Flavobacteriales bacterium]NCG29233.1 tetratricopeptide repeat protein [Bacteroidota bacterium]MBT4703998.1 tetratricopeptide repeat protein [Flavobacteriales bacterium]MBT4930306.1 tetratricopeptide repeat protein [Flavobacteriales bacterium]MBT5132529.1 tetratricopeptide repeat protein [Flavobacteriales bacterium]